MRADGLKRRERFVGPMIRSPSPHNPVLHERGFHDFQRALAVMEPQSMCKPQRQSMCKP
eukprot:CAMPEP_0175890944 /NCGR_PEP_ID=MMETSP0107_2-20121207/48111_1 /TAXON_ID=195067 ORGANISM="Goniomonas pacifica, Strain CCMP1869" /NCGR_SAMPLE_ID=MMETSP0107_2 /ASSEMBLY_ACC=CAM_ASM_000203 /LENGTH=58 /DNA_ID=CAMNT_0017211769 /DNA_START=409 /DNA_END=585 /DNA_ORIENTATION=+